MSLYNRETKELERKKREEEIRAEEDRRARLLVETFSTPAGKETLNMLMNYCGFLVQSTPLQAGDPNYIPYVTYFNEGKRNVYLSIRGLIMRLDPKLISEVEFLKKQT